MKTSPVTTWMCGLTSNAPKAWPRAHKHIYLMGIEMAPICTPAIAQRLLRVEDSPNETLLHHTNFPDNWAVWWQGAGSPKVQPELGPGFDLQKPHRGRSSGDGGGGDPSLFGGARTGQR